MNRSADREIRKIIYCILIILFCFTRLWKLTELPYGLHIDEAGMAYSAWSLAEYGVDRYLKSWPVYLPNFEFSQSAMYAYACVVLFKIFGYHLMLVRLPAVLFSFLNLIFGILTARKIFPKNDIIPLMVGGLLVVCPYFIMAGRFGLDCNLMLGMSTVFLYCFTNAIESGRMCRYILAGVAGGMVLYTYALSYVALPIFLMLALAYLVRVKAFSVRGWFAMAVPMGFLAFPLILVQIINIFDLPEFRIGCFTIAKLGKNRASELGRFHYASLCNAFKAIFEGDKWNYNTAPGYANLYGPAVVFFLIGAIIILRGFWKSVKNREANTQVFPLLWLVGMLLLGAHIEANVNRMNGIFYCVILFVAVGINGLCTALKKYSMAAVVMIAGIYLLYFGKFASYYFGEYTDENFPLSYFDIPVAEAVELIEQDSALCTKTTQMAEHGLYYALSTLKSPYDLDVQKIEQESQFENYQFGRLEEIDDQRNYIVREDFVEYCEELRAAGFMEERYQKYSLFYKK